ncbi:MAG: FAD-binding protein, partial [Patescibacteria group bacterium]|nr:FAD-binding protein [Patescibacteria group bacterium]
MNNRYQELVQKIGKPRVKLDASLSECTTVGIGGSADLLYTTKNSRDLQRTVVSARECDVPVTVLGCGSNVLIADKGIRGLVVINTKGGYSVEHAKMRKKIADRSSVPDARCESDKTRGTLKYEFNDLNYDESHEDSVCVNVESGLSMPVLIRLMLGRGITGLQWFAGIPGTVGGAVVNNLHGGTRFISEVIDWVEVLTKENKVERLDNKELMLDYDKSVFHKSGDIVLRACLRLFLGDSNKAKFTADEWAKRKIKVQPQSTPGCIFKNISHEERERLGFPTTGTGFIIEHGINFSGYSVGDAVISSKHHNFIENMGGATASDYL